MQVEYLLQTEDNIGSHICFDQAICMQVYDCKL